MLEERIREMEADLERITGVRSARMRIEGGEISEVHIVATSDRRPKWIARDASRPSTPGTAFGSRTRR